ncbi:MAG: hypothetical protein JXA04_01275 [Gammaproteobacteria bacterium]|nr:hypothetical protein [Gammaproteobacteria bacterium]
MFKAIILFLPILFFLVIAGCAQVRFPVQMPDGSIEMGQYTRWGNQKIEGFKLKSPEGWEISFDQESDFEVGFKMGVMSVTAGSGK